MTEPTAKSKPDSDDEWNSDDDDDEYSDWFQSIRSPTGLEIGVKVTWPEVRELTISTILEEAEIAPMFHGTQWAGTRVWRAAVVALQYLLLFQDNPCRLERRERLALTERITAIGPETQILELGCGLGIPGILLHEITKASVVVSDMDSLVDQLKINLEKNFPTNLPDSERLQAHALDWSEKGVEDLLKNCDRTGKGFDIVLNCDCVYEPLYGRDAWVALVACQKALIKANPQTILMTSLERRTADGVENYLEAMRAVARVVEKIKVPFPHASEVEVYLAYGLLE